MKTQALVRTEIGAVEEQLASLWKAASPSEDEAAVVRACSANLLVLPRDRDDLEDLQELFVRLAEVHPSRSIVALRDDTLDQQQGDMQAWIGARCAVPFAGGPQVCCEVIVVSARGPAWQQLPHTLTSLMVPDLPVFVYWRHLDFSTRPWIQTMGPIIDLLILDSRMAKEDIEVREAVLGLLRRPPGKMAVRDLNWSRLTAWRDLLAQFFDVPGTRNEARDIRRVEICRTVSSRGTVPTRALLLSGWLASRLDWRLRSSDRRGDDWISRWEGPGGEVEVVLRGNPPAGDRDPGIDSVVLETGKGSVFTVAREAGSACMNATARKGGKLLTHTVPRESLDEAALLAQELSLSGRDSGFMEALARALALERSFRPT